MRELRERLRRRQEGAGCTSAHHRRPLRFNHPGTPGPSPPPTTIHLQDPQGVDGTRNDALFGSEIALRGATSQPLPNGRAPARTAGRGQRGEGGVVGRATRAPSPTATTPTASASPKVTTPAPPSAATSPPRRATSSPSPARLSRRERVVRYPVRREYPPSLPCIPSDARGRPQHPRILPNDWEGEQMATSTHHHNTQYTHRHRPH